jgi:hypothetical protein
MELLRTSEGGTDYTSEERKKLFSEMESYFARQKPLGVDVKEEQESRKRKTEEPESSPKKKKTKVRSMTRFFFSLCSLAHHSTAGKRA